MAFDAQQRLYDIAECETIVEKVRNLRDYMKRAARRVQDTRASNDIIAAAEGLGDILHDSCQMGTTYLTAEYDDLSESERMRVETFGDIPKLTPVTTPVRKLDPRVWGDLDTNAGEGEF